jgi:hypothetical protein
MRGDSVITEINNDVVVRGTMKELKVFNCFQSCTPKQTPRVVRVENYIFAITTNGNGRCISLKMALTENETELKKWIDSIFADHGRSSYANVTDVFLMQRIENDRDVNIEVLA